MTVNGEAALQQHDGSRTSRWVGARAGLNLPLGVILGSARAGSVVAAPSIESDTAQTILDLQGLVSWQRTRVGLEVGLSQTHSFQPFSYQPFLLYDSLHALGTTRWLTVAGRVSPRQWLTIEGWYSDPLGTVVEGRPPNIRISRVPSGASSCGRFPAGIFDLKLQLGMEAWSDGIIGRDASGAAIKLGGATFFRSVVQMKLGGLILFWDRSILSGNKRSYVPEYFVPRFGSTFGARWEFSN